MSGIVQQVHGTALRLNAGGLLLIGASGSGKSDLALRLIDRGAMLVADDRVDITNENGMAIARPPARIAGRMEVRGLGLIAVPYAASGTIRLVLDLDVPPARLPSPGSREFVGISLPCLAFDPFPASAAIRAEWAVALAAVSGLWWDDE
ncbi:MAG: HPr kinase/phosphatase C-terminal domain-containing protein [Sphingomonadaceae bacterium]